MTPLWDYCHIRKTCLSVTDGIFHTEFGEREAKRLRTQEECREIGSVRYGLVGGIQADKALFEGVMNEFGLIVDAQFFHDIRPVGLDRAPDDDQARRNGARCRSLGR